MCSLSTKVCSLNVCSNLRIIYNSIVFVLQLENIYCLSVAPDQHSGRQKFPILLYTKVVHSNPGEIFRPEATGQARQPAVVEPPRRFELLRTISVGFLIIIGIECCEVISVVLPLVSSCQI